MGSTEKSDQDRALLFTKIHDSDVAYVSDFIDKNKEIAPFNNEKGESAAAVALKSKQLGVYEVLISRAWCLNSNENFTEIVNNLKKILKTELHEIKENFKTNPTKLTSLIEKFLDRNRYILPNNYDEGKSALAIKHNQLLSDGKISKIVSEFHFALKSELREIHRRILIKDPNEEHLTALITRTRIYFEGRSAITNRRNYLDLIAGAYEELNEVPEIKAIFKVVANIKNLNITFDFNRESIEHADPTGSNLVQGKTYAETGEVYVGAKGLTEVCSDLSRLFSEHDDKVKRSEVLGVLAHELCHVAIFRVYNNDYKPYHKDDSKGWEDFESALCECEKKLGKEGYIDVVLNGPELIMHEELCVRVPHLLALYQGNNEKIKFLKETFKKIFVYFETKTLADLKEEENFMSAVWKLKSKEPQHLTDQKILISPRTNELVLDSIKVLEISSNCLQMTLNWIFQEITNKINSNFLFLALYHLKDEETNTLILDAHSSCMKPIIIIDCDNEIEKEIRKIGETMKIVERIIFLHNYKETIIKDTTFLKVSHSWLELEDQSKENLMKTMINFQGEEILLEEVVDRNCDALEFVPLKELLDNNLKIGKDLESEIDFHIKRKFQNDKAEEIEPSYLLNIAETSKLILLCDGPGMGKTTELQMLSMEFKKKFKHFWVAFVDLKEYSDFYVKDENFKTNFKSSEEIINFFATKIFKLNEFEKRVFKHLFSGNRVVLLFDGFDEISPSFKMFVTMLIKSIKTYSSNILITSTRPHMKDELCEELNVEAYTLLPLTEENCYEILELSIEKNGIDGGDSKKIISRTKDYFRNLTESYEPVRNPLILRMIAKVFINDQFTKEMQLNTFSIYKNFVKTMIMESMKKGEDAREEAASCLLIGFNFGSFYQKEAFKIIFEHNESVKDKFENCFDLCFLDVPSPLDEHITRIALMKPDGSGKIRFIHRTFAEFFVADFFFKNVFDLKDLKERKKKDQMNENQLEAIYKIVQETFCPPYRFYHSLRSFIDGAFENLVSNIEKLEKKVLISTFHDIFTRDELPNFFEKFVSESLLNLITVITRCVDKHELNRLWIEQKYLVDPNGKKYGNIFMLAARDGSLYFNRELTALARRVFDERDFVNFFTEKSVKGETVASYAAKHSNSPNAVDFYCDTNVFPLSDLKKVWPEEAKLTALLRVKDVSGFQEQLERIEEDRGLEYLRRFLNQWEISGETFYLEACANLSKIEDFEKLWILLRRILDENDFKSLLTKPTRYGTTPLMFKAQSRNQEVFISFWRLFAEVDEEEEKYLLEEDQFGKNSFICATLNEDPKTFLVVKDLYVGIFGEDKMRILLTKERSDGGSILFYSVEFYYKNIETMKALWAFIQEICDASTQKMIFMKTNENGANFYRKLDSKSDFEERLNIFQPFIEQQFTSLEKEQFEKEIDKLWLPNYFTEKNENGESVVSLTFNNNRSDVTNLQIKLALSPDQQISETELYSEIESQIFRFLKKEDLSAFRSAFEKIKETELRFEYLQHFLNSWTFDGDSIYLTACNNLSIYSSLEEFERLWNLLRRIFGENDFKSLLKKPSSTHGKTPLMVKAEKCRKDFFVPFWKLINEGKDEEKVNFLRNEDRDERNLFDYATLNEDRETFLFIKELYLKAFGEDQMRLMLTRERKNGESILFHSVESLQNNDASLKALWIFIHEIFEISEQKTILMKTDMNRRSFYVRRQERRQFYKKMEIFEPFVVQNFTEIEKEQFKYGDKGWLRYFFKEKDEYGESMVSLASKNNRSVPSAYDTLNDDEFYLEIESQIFQLFEHQDFSTLRDGLETMKHAALRFEYFQLFLNSWRINGQTNYLNFIRKLSHFEQFEKLWNLLRRILGEINFKSLLKKSNSHGTTPLMSKAECSNEDVFISFWRLLTEDLTNEEKEKLLTEKDSDGDNPFNCAAFNVKHQNFLVVKDLYVEILGKDRMRIMLLKERNNGENILLATLKNGYQIFKEHLDNSETVKALWTFIQEICDLSTLKTIIMKPNKNEEAFYRWYLREVGFDKRAKIFEPFIENQLTTLEKHQFEAGEFLGFFRNFFTNRDESGESVVSLAFKNNPCDPSSYEKLSDIELFSEIESQIFRYFDDDCVITLKSELENIQDVARGLEYFQHFLNSLLIDGGTIYLKACESLSGVEDYKELWSLLRTILGENDFKTLLNKSDKRGTTPLMLKAYYDKKEVFVSFWDLLTEGLTDKAKVKILIDEDDYEMNLFDCATINQDHETFLVIKNLYMGTFGEAKVKEMLTRERDYGESILHVSVRYLVDNSETTKALWTFIQEIFDVSTQKTILMKADEDGRNFYSRLFERQNFNDIKKIFEPFIEQQLTELDKEQFQNESGESIPSTTAKNNRRELFDFQSKISSPSHDQFEAVGFLSEIESTMQYGKDLERYHKADGAIDYFQRNLSSFINDGESIFLEASKRNSSIEDFVRLLNFHKRFFDGNAFDTGLLSQLSDHFDKNMS